MRRCAMAELVKVTALVSEDLRRKARIKALGEGMSLSSVLRNFLEEWAGKGNETHDHQAEAE
jgi:hypothetical protein